ncbi:MAG: hypothetical protein IJ365_02740 [Clostridia bacterium]|nr:hypothetical protein [Clostridia bacterium]
MAGYEHAFRAICGKCDKSFNKEFRIYTVVNTDFRSNLVEKLKSDKLNTVTCPFCNAVFTYERPHLAYSLSKKYAINALCSYSGGSRHSGRSHMFHMFGIRGMRFRLVNYLCEVSEKVRIFEHGLDDIKIEQIKYNNFGEEYFADKSDKILLFREICCDDIIFEFRDDVDNVLETHRLPYEEYARCGSLPQPPTQHNGAVIWTKIDNNYIKEIIND